MPSQTRTLQLIIAVLSMVLLNINSSPAVELIGYVPHYRLSNNYVNNILPKQLSILDEVRYFGLSVNSAGEITSLSGSVGSQKKQYRYDPGNHQ